MAESEMKACISYNLNLFADYHQFYLQDKLTEADIPADWGEQLTTQMITVAPGIIGIGTARDMSVPVQVDLLATPPDDDFMHWDHVAEASLDVPSGQIVIAGCTDYLPEAKHLSVSPQSYRARVYYGGLNTLSEDGLDGDDHYYVAIWPETYQSPKILKKWSSL